MSEASYTLKTAASFKKKKKIFSPNFGLLCHWPRNEIVFPVVFFFISKKLHNFSAQKL